MKQIALAEALQRVSAVLQRRPEAGLHEDVPALARWEGGTRCVALHPQGLQMATDMPCELGGTGDQVTPGWLFRAGLASCAATSILMTAATEGIALSRLEVRATSRSDARGLLGLADEHGVPVYGGPGDMGLQVQIAAPGVPAERLRALVERGLRNSPVPNAVQQATALALQIETGA